MADRDDHRFDAIRYAFAPRGFKALHDGIGKICQRPTPFWQNRSQLAGKSADCIIIDDPLMQRISEMEQQKHLTYKEREQINKTGLAGVDSISIDRMSDGRYSLTVDIDELNFASVAEADKVLSQLLKIIVKCQPKAEKK